MRGLQPIGHTLRITAYFDLQKSTHLEIHVMDRISSKVNSGSLWMNMHSSVDRKLAFYAPVTFDKYRDSVVYAGEVELYTSPSIDDGYGTGVALAGVIDGREVIGRLRRGLYHADISFLCTKTREELFVGDLMVPRGESEPLLLILSDHDPKIGRLFASESAPSYDPALKEWGEVKSIAHDIRDSLFGTNQFRVRQVMGG